MPALTSSHSTSSDFLRGGIAVYHSFESHFACGYCCRTFILFRYRGTLIVYDFLVLAALMHLYFTTKL